MTSCSDDSGRMVGDAEDIRASQLLVSRSRNGRVATARSTFVDWPETGFEEVRGIGTLYVAGRPQGKQKVTVLDSD